MSGHHATASPESGGGPQRFTWTAKSRHLRSELEVDDMLEAVRRMVSRSLDALVGGDPGLAGGVIADLATDIVFSSRVR